MKYVTSTDGAEIAYEKRGSGKPVVLIHGTSGTRHSWRALVSHLSEKHTVVTYDRRGRGKSTDSAEYGLDREVDDAMSVLDAVDGDPVLFGHSFGGLVALEVARNTELDGLVLYEPAILTEREKESHEVVARMENSIEDGNVREAVELYFRDAGGMTDPDEEVLQRGVSLIDTVLRECRLVESYKLDETVDTETPTLILTGENGPQHLRAAVHRLEEVIYGSRISELKGVGHVGIFSDPEQVASRVDSFLKREVPVSSSR